ncbi:MAG: hypothetical protein IJF11_04900 [Clostridia bacterium]|nr:hypothetical protein [Clostridia bacterium]
MKKLLALMLALIACFTMLVSCGPDEESSSSSEESSSVAGGEGNLPEEDISNDFEVEFK